MTCDDDDSPWFESGVCPCCERVVSELHLMEWDGPLSQLCSECADGATEDCDEDDSGDDCDADEDVEEHGDE